MPAARAAAGLIRNITSQAGSGKSRAKSSSPSGTETSSASPQAFTSFFERDLGERAHGVVRARQVLFDEKHDQSGEVAYVDHLNRPIQPFGDRDRTRAGDMSHPVGEELGRFVGADHPPGPHDAEPIAETREEEVLQATFMEP